MQNDTKLILSLYPNSYGVGYVCFELPKKLLDSGVMKVRPLGNEKLLERVKVFTEFHKPTIIVLRDCDIPGKNANRRVKRLAESIATYAEHIKVPVYRYTRQQVRDFFELQGATTKAEIAKQIIVWFPELADRAPRIRKSWESESYTMGIFDALALAITHEYLTE